MDQTVGPLLSTVLELALLLGGGPLGAVVDGFAALDTTPARDRRQIPRHG
jgi:hypothetical protein